MFKDFKPHPEAKKNVKKNVTNQTMEVSKNDGSRRDAKRLCSKDFSQLSSENIGSLLSSFQHGATVSRATHIDGSHPMNDLSITHTTRSISHSCLLVFHET